MKGEWDMEFEIVGTEAAEALGRAYMDLWENATAEAACHWGEGGIGELAGELEAARQAMIDAPADEAAAFAARRDALAAELRRRREEADAVRALNRAIAHWMAVTAAALVEELACSNAMAVEAHGLEALLDVVREALPASVIRWDGARGAIVTADLFGCCVDESVDVDAPAHLREAMGAPTAEVLVRAVLERGEAMRRLEAIAREAMEKADEALGDVRALAPDDLGAMRRVLAHMLNGLV